LQFLFIPVGAQDADSLTVINQQWDKNRVKKGIVWKSAHFEQLFGGKQAVNVIEVDLKRHIKKSKLAGLAEGMMLTSALEQENRAKKRIVWKSGHFEQLFGGKQAVNVIEVDLKRHLKKLKLAGLSEGMKLTSALAQENRAVVAVNGGFFNTQIGGAVDFIKI